MAGTRLWIVAVFTLELLALVGWSVHESFVVERDLLWQWWRLWTLQQHPTIPKEDGWKTLLHAHAEAPLPTLRVHVETRALALAWETQREASFGAEEAVHWTRTHLLTEPTLRSSVCQDKDAVNNDEEEEDIADLYICEKDSSKDAKEANALRVHVRTDGSLVVVVSPSDLAQVMKKVLRPFSSVQPQQQQFSWPGKTCMEPLVDLRFLVPDWNTNVGSQDDNFELWQPWVQALNQARGSFISWSPIDLMQETATTIEAPPVTTKIHVQSVLVSNLEENRNTDRIALNELPLEVETKEDSNHTVVLHRLSLEAVESFLDRAKKATTRNTGRIPIYLLLSPPQSSNNIEVVMLDQDRQPYIPKLPCEPSLAASNDALFAVLPPLATRDHASSCAPGRSAQTLIRHVMKWIAKQCLGLSHNQLKQTGASLLTKTTPQTPHVLASWWTKMFWERALTKLYRESFWGAKDTVERHETWSKQQQEQQERDVATPMEVLLGLLPTPPTPEPASTTAEAALEKLMLAHALAGQGQYTKAIRLLCGVDEQRLHQPCSSRSKQQMDDNNLILDLSADQYAAIVAPLLVPLVLPALVAVVRELKRFLRKR